jgi:hypothetical protein
MASSRVLVTDDHLDLLVTAAVRYRVLLPAASAAFTNAGIVASPAQAGQTLQHQQHRAAAAAPPYAEPPAYRFRPVTDLEPVEVLKAAHGYADLAASSPSWASSPARRLLEAIERAAVRQLPGYAAAPYHWTRPAQPAGGPVGLRRVWIPPVNHDVTWIDSHDTAQVRRRWLQASHILITVDAVADLPPALPTRDSVYVLANEDGRVGELSAVVGDPFTGVVLCPQGLGWLEQELASPGVR